MEMMIRRQLAAKKNKKRGFTLIELIVVIVIIAIIAAIAVPSLTRYIGNAEQRQVQAMAHNIQLVLQAERSDQYSIAKFNDSTDISTQPNAYALGGNNVTYLSILNESGIVLKDTDELTGITWGGTIDSIDYNNTTLTGFKISNGKYSVIYAVNTGFQAPQTVVVTP